MVSGETHRLINVVDCSWQQQRWARNCLHQENCFHSVRRSSWCFDIYFDVFFEAISNILHYRLKRHISANNLKNSAEFKKIMTSPMELVIGNYLIGFGKKSCINNKYLIAIQTALLWNNGTQGFVCLFYLQAFLRV